MQVGGDSFTRHTRGATERTYLAWWRTGLAALAVGLAAGKLVPELSGGTSWPYELLGVGYSLLGIAFIAYGHRRQHVVEAAVQRGEWAPFRRERGCGADGCRRRARSGDDHHRAGRLVGNSEV